MECVEGLAETGNRHVGNILREINWEQVKDIFQAALEHPVSERENFLRGVCRENENLRLEVAELLQSHEDDEGFMEHPAIGEVADLLVVEENNLRAGERIGRYEISEKIGAGGMGEVYLAEDTELERLVALKMLSAEFSDDDERVRRFIQEAKSASALNHPNILTIYEIGQSGDLHFIATEYIKGATLREKIKNRSLTVIETLEIAAQIAAALNAAHSAGIVHRDIKPENVMLREDGLVKVLDFGLAKLVTQKIESAAKNQVQTTPGLVMGTVAYMSPEQTRGKPTDRRTDVWSLGVVLFEMLGGFQPFTGETTSDTIAAILKNETPPLTRNVPAALEQTVGKALRKNADERYQNIRDFHADLKNLQKEAEFAEAINHPQSSAAAEKPTVFKLFRTTKGKAATDANGVSDRHNSDAPPVAVQPRTRKIFSIGILAAFVVALFAGSYFSDLPSVYSAWRSPSFNSVAVLPFVNEDRNPDSDYLSDGLSERLIDDLAALPQLKVISRSSSFRYRDAELDLRQIAENLGVQTIVTGRVSQRGDSLIVSAELIDCRDLTRIWSGQYQRRAVDLQDVEEIIAQTVSAELRLRLSGAQQEQLAKHETVNPEAFETMLKGNYYWNKGGTENRLKAVEFYRHAIAVDPNYALAHAELSIRLQALFSQGTLDPNVYLPQAEELARRAVALDDNLSEAHLALADLKKYKWEWTAAEPEYQRAIELNPNSVRAHREYGRYLSTMQRHAEAAAEFQRAVELDPISLPTNANRGQALYFAGRYDEAIELLKKTVETDKTYPAAHVYLGYNYAAKKMYREAIAEYQTAFDLGDDSPSLQIFLGAACAGAGEYERARTILTALETGKEYVSPGELAVLPAALGDYERAFGLLERAFAEHDLQLQFLAVDPAFNPLHRDRRFPEMVRRLALPNF